MSDSIGAGTDAVGGGRRQWRRSAAFAAVGLLAGGALAGTVTANADSSESTSSASEDNRQHPGGVDESKPQRQDETLLTGDTAERVRAAALAEYPGATIQRIETDSDGVYEAHLVTANGERVTVEVGEDFAVTGTESTPRDDHHPRPTDTETKSS